MILEEKINLIKENKDAVVAALNGVLDDIYNLYEPYFDEDGKLNPELVHDEKLESFIKELEQDSKRYENLRRRIIDGDFNLSLTEINSIGITFLHMSVRLKKEIQEFTKAAYKAEDLTKKLMDLENKEIDF